MIQNINSKRLVGLILGGVSLNTNCVEYNLKLTFKKLRMLLPN
jgi:hypothetical protein